MKLTKEEKEKNKIFKKFQETISGMVITHGKWSSPIGSCEIKIGFYTTPDNRKAQVTIKANVDKDEWL